MDIIDQDRIEAKAAKLRARLGMAKICAPDIAAVLANFAEAYPGFRIERRLDDEMPIEEAWMDTETKVLQVRESVYHGALSGRPRARFTIMHELGHLVLGHRGRFQRKEPSRTYDNAQIRKYETEADAFASSFLAPTSLCLGLEEFEIADRFQVSNPAAEIIKRRVDRHSRTISGTKRRLPPAVVDFLKEARSRGKKLVTDLSEYEDK